MITPREMRLLVETDDDYQIVASDQVLKEIDKILRSIPRGSEIYEITYKYKGIPLSKANFYMITKTLRDIGYRVCTVYRHDSDYRITISWKRDYV